MESYSVLGQPGNSVTQCHQGFGLSPHIYTYGQHKAKEIDMVGTVEATAILPLGRRRTLRIKEDAFLAIVMRASYSRAQSLEARFTSGSPKATLKTLDNYISPFEPQPIMKPISQTTSIHRLPQLPRVENTALLTTVNLKSYAYPQTFMHISVRRLFARIFQSPIPNTP